MKARIHTLQALIVCAALTTKFGRAAETATGPAAEISKPFPRDSAELVKQFDANKDGRLDTTERQALRQAREREWQEVLRQFDKNKDGKLDARERAQRAIVQRQELEKQKQAAKPTTGGPAVRP
jgi:cell wall assembly regulator SMI1